MLCSAQSLPRLRIWGPNSGFKVQLHNLLAKQILKTGLLLNTSMSERLWSASVNHAQWAGTRWGLITIVCRFFTQWFHKSHHFGWEDRLFYTSVNVKLNTFHAGFFFAGPYEMWTEKQNTSACLWLNEFALQSALLIPFKLVNSVEMLQQLAPEQIQQFLLGEGFCGWQIVALVGAADVVGSPCLGERTVQRSFDWSVCLFELCWHLCVCVCMCAPMSLRVVLASLNAQQVD